MNCPICHHGDSRVVRTVDTALGIRRHRRCRQCGHDWQTVEQPTSKLERDREVVAKARELAELLKAA